MSDRMNLIYSKLEDSLSSSSLEHRVVTQMVLNNIDIRCSPPRVYLHVDPHLFLKYDLILRDKIGAYELDNQPMVNREMYPEFFNQLAHVEGCIQYLNDLVQVINLQKMQYALLAEKKLETIILKFPIRNYTELWCDVSEK